MVKNLVLKAAWSAGYLSGRTHRTRTELREEVSHAYQQGHLMGRWNAVEEPIPCAGCGDHTERMVPVGEHLMCDACRKQCTCIPEEPESQPGCQLHGEN